MKLSHTVPPSGAAKKNLIELRAACNQLDINEFVLSEYTGAIAATLRAYISLIERSWKIYRYEDVIFNKANWLRDLADYLDMDVPAEALCLLAKSVDHVPSVENPHAHIRQVAPGNHERHLSRLTIIKLNETLADVLHRFGYLPSARVF
jgi:hypothetical protein